MKAHLEEIRNEVLELLRQQRSRQEISDRTGISIGTIQDWAAEWRKEGTAPVIYASESAFSFNRAPNRCPTDITSVSENDTME